jgi:phosphatidylserine/phosphatidylglycerophosphate/cardiolipin synthase-like enzyme
MKLLSLFLIFISITSIEPHFCFEENCLEIVKNITASADNQVNCAFYNIDKTLLDHLNNLTSEVKTISHHRFPNVKKINSRGLMHNKFCIIDNEIVLTGSFNPTKNNSYDDLLIIKDKKVAKVYQTEFNELWTENFSISKNNEFKNFQAYFCPADDCASKLVNEINKAKVSINFITYSFTSKEVAIALAKKRHLEIKGILDKSQISKYSMYHFLDRIGLNIKPDSVRELMHFKLFIIDNETIVTGSYNPTRNGQLNNNENMIIIKDEDIAKLYSNIFGKLWLK